MPYLVRYEIDDDDWRALAEEVRARAADLRPVMKQAGEYMLLEVDERFRKERGPDGKPWQALAASTLQKQFTRGNRSRKRKRRTHRRDGQESAAFARFAGAKKILQEDGTRGGLRGSITYRAYRAALEHGTNKIYGAIHQLGGKAGRGHRVTIPARPYLGYSEENVAVIREMVRRYLLGAGDAPTEP